WPVMVDRAQLGAAITNLATNARDAMPDGGRLTISTHNTGLDEDYAASHADVATGDYVLIEVSDNGTGMSPMVLAHIFEPFFTTKGPGRGTGLGLSMVFGFIKQSGGHVTAYSELGAGTTFRLYLPPVPAFVEIVEPMATVAPPPGRGETIDLLLSDIVMPGGMNGHDLAQAAALRRPTLKVLLTTGFSDVSSGNPA